MKRQRSTIYFSILEGIAGSIGDSFGHEYSFSSSDGWAIGTDHTDIGRYVKGMCIRLRG